MINREIKFRAWHIGEEKMCEVNLLRPNNGAFLLGVMPSEDQQVGDRFLVIAPDDGRYCDLAEFQLMQYTGLKDKNGKEIYEGDIVNVENGIGTGKTYKGKVIWFDEGCQFITQHLNDTGEWDVMQDADFGGDYEVIGNIYENPELIK